MPMGRGGVNGLSFLRCFDTVGYWMTGRTRERPVPLVLKGVLL